MLVIFLTQAYILKVSRIPFVLVLLRPDPEVYNYTLLVAPVTQQSDSVSTGYIIHHTVNIYSLVS